MSYLANNEYEAERASIARELHDDTIQSLVAIAQGIDMGRQWYEIDPSRASAMLQATHQYTVDTIEALRNLIADLKPPALEELGLVAALKGLSQKSSDPAVSVTVGGTERRLHGIFELALYRCAQEALANIRGYKQAMRVDIEIIYLKVREGLIDAGVLEEALASIHCYKQAMRVDIEIIYLKDEVCLIISDNGCGPISSKYLEDFATNSHYGFLTIQERVEHSNGRFQISGQPDIGITIKVSIPIEQEPQPLHAVRDPVCRKLIKPNQSYASMDYQGKHYYFCCPVCYKAFQHDPEAYMQA